jgi:hypothetical protein
MQSEHKTPSADLSDEGILLPQLIVNDRLHSVLTFSNPALKTPPFSFATRTIPSLFTISHTLAPTAQTIGSFMCVV